MQESEGWFVDAGTDCADCEAVLMLNLDTYLHRLCAFGAARGDGDRR